MNDSIISTLAIEILIPSKTAELFTNNGSAILNYLGELNDVQMKVVPRLRVNAPMTAVFILGKRERVAATQSQIQQISRVGAVCYRYFQLE